jgi:hypothetical protein
MSMGFVKHGKSWRDYWWKSDGMRVLAPCLRFVRTLHAKLESAGCKQVGWAVESVREGI